MVGLKDDKTMNDIADRLTGHVIEYAMKNVARMKESGYPINDWDYSDFAEQAIIDTAYDIEYLLSLRTRQIIEQIKGKTQEVKE